MDGIIADWELVPPHSHCRNVLERLNLTWKNHFFAALVSTNVYFQMNLWDCLIPQATTTSNLLYTLRIKPNVYSKS